MERIDARGSVFTHGVQNVFAGRRRPAVKISLASYIPSATRTLARFTVHLRSSFVNINLKAVLIILSHRVRVR